MLDLFNSEYGHIIFSLNTQRCYFCLIILEIKQDFKTVICSELYLFFVMNKCYRKLERYVYLDMYIDYDIHYGISN